jgi:hypothetical protein
MLTVKSYIVFLILIMISFKGQCQQNIRIHEIDSRQLNDLYLQKTGSSREYIDGKDYFPYYYRSETTPILRPEEERAASLTIHGRTYIGLVLQYDTYTDGVIYTDDSLIYNNRVCEVSLNKDCISRFDLFFSNDTMRFRYFCGESDTTFNLPQGFYEVAYDMQSKFLIRHVSSAVISPDKVESYVYTPVNYIKVNNGYAGIESRKQFISLFGNRSEEISHFLRQKHIRIKKADKEQITGVLKYYEALLSGVV